MPFVPVCDCESELPMRTECGRRIVRFVEATRVYTDGACRGNPGPGGWAWAVSGGPFASGSDAATTNNRMELTAAWEAVRNLPGPLVVVSDSTYVVHCFRDRWYQGWQRKGWKRNGGPIVNLDLWKPLIELFQVRQGEVSFEWVRGHSGDHMNDVVDRLAVEAAETQRGRSGSGSPRHLGPADRPAGGRSPAGPSGSSSAHGPAAGRVEQPAAGRVEQSAAGRVEQSVAGGVEQSVAALVEQPAVGRAGGAQRPTGGRLKGDADVGVPEGHRVAILGHRPPDLGGYGDNPVAAAVRRRLTEVLVGLRAIHPDLVVLTGLGLGAEQLGAAAAAAARVGYVAVLAFPNQEAVWPQASKDAYRSLLAGAAATITLSNKTPATKQAAGAAIGRRTEWLAATADGALVVWDGKDRSLGETVAALERRLPDDVWVIAPPTD